MVCRTPSSRTDGLPLQHGLGNKDDKGVVNDKGVVKFPQGRDQAAVIPTQLPHLILPRALGCAGLFREGYGPYRPSFSPSGAASARLQRSIIISEGLILFSAKPSPSRMRQSPRQSLAPDRMQDRIHRT